ncbi:MAG TPA: BTAD domain-containing putative transcriptional regulator [Trebonia sp.]
MQPATSGPGRPGLRLRLLGRFELSDGESLIRTRPSSERLLAFLAVRGDPVGRPEAAAALWPDCSDTRAASNLRSVLWRLPVQQGGVVSARDGRLALAPDIVTDLTEIASRLADGTVTGDEKSLSLLQQEVLPGWPETWLVTTRESFHQVRLRALERLCDQHREAGHMDSALAAGLAAVACDPLRESAHRRLAVIHISEGNLADALRQYHVYRDLVRSELGLPPSPQFRRLIAPLLGRPADQTAGNRNVSGRS